MTATLSTPLIADAEQIFTLDGVTWDQYVAMNDALADRAGLRMLYLGGSLTLLTLSRRHDWYEDILDEIVKVVARGCGIDYEVAGSATFRVEGVEAGLEGDRTYYFGPHARIMKGPTDIDLTTQPPPDLAIEVEVSHRADKVMAIYSRIGVPEVWRFDVKKNQLGIFLLSPTGTYELSEKSRVLSMIGSVEILGQVKLAEDLDSTSQWFRQLENWVRNTLVPRLGE